MGKIVKFMGKELEQRPVTIKSAREYDQKFLDAKYSFNVDKSIELFKWLFPGQEEKLASVDFEDANFEEVTEVLEDFFYRARWTTKEEFNSLMQFAQKLEPRLDGLGTGDKSVVEKNSKNDPLEN